MLLLFAAALFGVVISKGESKFSSSVRTSVVDVTSPVISTIAAPFHFFANFKESIGNYMFVYSKNERLEAENMNLRKQLIQLSSAAYENVRLRKLLNYMENSSYEYITVKVVGNTSDPFLRSILISAGKNDSIKKGQAVVNESGLVGRISEVGEKSSRVLLISDINSNIPVVSSLSRERAIMSGNNNEAPTLEYLLSDNKISEGEVVVTSGDGGMFPSGINVGTVERPRDGVYKVVPFVEVHRLDNLSVIDYQ